MDEVERVVLNALANNAVLPPDKSCVFGEADPPAIGASSFLGHSTFVFPLPNPCHPRHPLGTP
jgi:hypothetical protein